MQSYTRKPGDVEYRKVPLRSDHLPEFTAFQSSGQTVNYSKDQVLEISCESGETKLIYEPDKNDVGKQTLSFSVIGNKVMIFNNVPIERLWMTDGSEMLYKLPAGLPMEDGQYYFTLAKVPENLAIVGDKYFEKAYDRG